jgi:hypothetical protein
MKLLRPGVFVPLCILLILPLTAHTQEKKKDVFLNIEDGGIECALQGEYEGMVGDRGKFGVQVVAQGNGKFDVYFMQGGLPGAGWDQKVKVRSSGKLEGDKVKFAEKGYRGEIANGEIKGGTEACEKFSFKYVLRKSPTLGAKPPAGAIVLFDGTSADAWNGGKLVEGKYLNWGVTSKKSFGAGKYHVEFRTPFMPKAHGQGRGNSGVFIMGPEIQVLDSFGLKGTNDECGAYYGQAKPAVNMCLPPLSWQTYDVEVNADKDGNAVATVWHNGVKIHENHKLGRKANQPAAIHLQNHGDPVYYQNIWYVPAKEPPKNDS